ncbi:MAG: molybdopterin synthase small subunit [Acidobacteria bacterium]|jgi:molybdopterin synthase sulfur carrier subunit|nr:molybdopterin synthase small subunit [Acidobacteriota bacterium]
MRIKIHSVLGIKQAIGQKITEIELPGGSTVEDFIAYVTEKWGDKLSSQLLDPDSGAVLPYVRIMINGQTIQYLQGVKTLLKEGDEVLLLPPASGG